MMEKVTDFNNTYCEISDIHFYKLAEMSIVFSGSITDDGYYFVSLKKDNATLEFYVSNILEGERKIEYNTKINDWVYVEEKEDFTDAEIDKILEFDYIQASNSDIKFEKPDFECKLLEEVDKVIVGYLRIDGDVIPTDWCKNTGTNEYNSDNYNLTPYKPKWYEVADRGTLLKHTRYDNIIGVFREYKDGYIYLQLNPNSYDVEDFKPLTLEETEKYIKG